MEKLESPWKSQRKAVVFGLTRYLHFLWNHPNLEDFASRFCTLMAMENPCGDDFPMRIAQLAVDCPSAGVPKWNVLYIPKQRGEMKFGQLRHGGCNLLQPCYCSVVWLRHVYICCLHVLNFVPYINRFPGNSTPFSFRMLGKYYHATPNVSHV